MPALGATYPSKNPVYSLASTPKIELKRTRNFMEFNLTTFLVQGGIFLYVLFILKYLFFAPVMEILHKRDEATVGKAGAAEEFEKQIVSLQEKYDQEVGALKASLEEARHETLRRQRELAEKKTGEARTRVERQAAEKRAALHQEYEKVRDRIPTLSEGVAKEVVSALMTSRVVRS